MDHLVSIGLYLMNRAGTSARLSWYVMLLLTSITYLSGLNQLETNAVLVIVLVSMLMKGTLIIREFMEVKHVAILWQIIMNGWLILTCTLIAILSI